MPRNGNAGTGAACPGSGQGRPHRLERETARPRYGFLERSWARVPPPCLGARRRESGHGPGIADPAERGDWVERETTRPGFGSRGNGAPVPSGESEGRNHAHTTKG